MQKAGVEWKILQTELLNMPDNLNEYNEIYLGNLRKCRICEKIKHGQ